MSKNLKLIITAAAITVAGAIIFVIGGIMTGFDIKGLSSETPTEATHVLEESFSKIDIRTTVSSVRLLPSDDSICRVECKETERIRHVASVTDGVLTVKLADGRAWYEKIGFFLAQMSVTVYLPEEEYERLTIEADTGSVTVKGGLTFGDADVECDTGSVTWEANVTGNAFFDCGTGKVSVTGAALSRLTVSCSTGSIRLTDVSAASVKLESDTGKVVLTDTLISGHLEIDTDTGSVTVKDSDAATVRIETDTGSVKGNFLTDKTFVAHSDTGSVRVPNTVGGRCEINTDTGSIRFE